MQDDVYLRSQPQLQQVAQQFQGAVCLRVVWSHRVLARTFYVLLSTFGRLHSVFVCKQVTNKTVLEKAYLVARNENHTSYLHANDMSYAAKDLSTMTHLMVREGLLANSTQLSV
eukprot:4439061-Amphidinium_carterae.1